MASASLSSISGSRTITSTRTRRTVLGLPVVAHQLAGPGRLVHRAARCELHHEGLDVEHRRAVDGVEPPHAELEAVDVDQLAPADPDAVGPRLPALGEDPHLRPVGIAPRTAGATIHGFGVDEMEEVDDLEMGELVEAKDGVGFEERVI